MLIIGLFLTLLIIQIHDFGDLQYRFDKKSNEYNMGYKQLLEDLSFRFGSDGTIITPCLETGTTMWSNFKIINLNQRMQVSLLGIDQILRSGNITLLFEFLKTNGVKFLIMPTYANWYYSIVDQRFIHQEEYLEKYYPKITLLLELEESLELIRHPLYLNITSISNCESKTKWNNNIGFLSVDLIDFEEGSGSLKSHGILQSNEWFSLTLDEDGTWDWKEKDLLSVWIKLESTQIPSFFAVGLHSLDENDSKTYVDAAWLSLIHI